MFLSGLSGKNVLWSKDMYPNMMQVAGLVGRPEKSLESFAACPSQDNPLVAFLGNEGCVPLVSLRSRQCVGDLKMSGTVRTAAFSSDGLELLTSGEQLPFL